VRHLLQGILPDRRRIEYRDAENGAVFKGFYRLIRFAPFVQQNVADGNAEGVQLLKDSSALGSGGLIRIDQQGEAALILKKSGRILRPGDQLIEPAGDGIHFASVFHQLDLRDQLPFAEDFLPQAAEFSKPEEGEFRGGEEAQGERGRWHVDDEVVGIRVPHAEILEGEHHRVFLQARSLSKNVEMVFEIKGAEVSVGVPDVFQGFIQVAGDPRLEIDFCSLQTGKDLLRALREPQLKDIAEIMSRIY